MHGKVNNKIDVYAFGVVLLELISGRKPLCTGCPKGQESLVMWVSSTYFYQLPLCTNFMFGLFRRNGSILWLKQIINCCLFCPGKFHHTRRKARTTCRSQLTYWRPHQWSWEDDPCCFPLHQTSTSEPSSNWCCKFFFSCWCMICVLMLFIIFLTSIWMYTSGCKASRRWQWYTQVGTITSRTVIRGWCRWMCDDTTSTRE